MCAWGLGLGWGTQQQQQQQMRHTEMMDVVLCLYAILPPCATVLMNVRAPFKMQNQLTVSAYNTSLQQSSHPSFTHCTDTTPYCKNCPTPADEKIPSPVSLHLRHVIQPPHREVLVLALLICSTCACSPSNMVTVSHPPTPPTYPTHLQPPSSPPPLPSKGPLVSPSPSPESPVSLDLSHIIQPPHREAVVLAPQCASNAAPYAGLAHTRGAYQAHDLALCVLGGGYSGGG